MAASENSDQRPQDPPPPAFMDALDAYKKGVEADNTEQIEAAALNALMIAAEEAEKNPSPSLVLKQEAADQEAHGDWAAAEACHRKVLALEEATGNHGLICKAHLDLSRLFLLIGDLPKAEGCARAATAEARRADIFPLLVMALENEALCALRRAEVAGALEAASEAVRIVEPGRMYDALRAGALASRARCRLAAADLAGAESDLAAAKPLLLDRKISPLFAGSNSRIAVWWEVMAKLRAQKGDLQGACEAWTEAVKTRRHVMSLPQAAGPHTLAALARTLRNLGEAFDAAGKPEEGQPAINEARRIWGELGLPDQQ